MKVAEKVSELGSFLKPHETRRFPNGCLELLNIGGATVGRAILEPGWRWSTSVKPIAKTELCEAPHFQYHVSGLLKVVTDDGKEFECRAGDVSLLAAGHDAWVVGNEPVVLVDWHGATSYAKK